MNSQIFEVLVALWDRERSTAEVRDEVLARTGKRPPITSFYRALRKAHASGLLEVLEEAEATGGRPAQRYRLTKAGRLAVAEEARKVQRLTSIVLDAQRSGEP